MLKIKKKKVQKISINYDELKRRENETLKNKKKWELRDSRGVQTCVFSILFLTQLKHRIEIMKDE